MTDGPPAACLPPRLSLRAVLAYDAFDTVSGVLICFTVVFGPWAFGTTQPWSTQVMNAAGYGLGGLLLAKLFIRAWLGHQPGRWENGFSTGDTSGNSSRVITFTLAALTAAILAYCLIAALNARAVYDPWRSEFTYLSSVTWLPQSYDRAKSFQAFATYLALACFFWSVRDWLLGKSSGEARAARTEISTSQTHFFPARLRLLLWLLCLSGTLLALEAIAQRLGGDGKLLWLLTPRINKHALDQFGPFAYRGNGAQYFNLLWPVALGFWWTLRRESRHKRSTASTRGEWKSHLLLPCVLLMAACPIISASRGGAAVAAGCLFVAAGIILAALRRRHAAVKFAALLFFGAVLAAGLWFGWETLSTRLKESEANYLQREDIYATARNIARDYPLFGTGPGTFDSVFQLYRSSTDEYWPAQLHNDWLETRITFGWVGSGFIALAFFLALARWFLPGKIQSGWRMTSLLWLALAGCLVHARFDFPLQVYSILHLFLLECAILFTVSRRQGARESSGA
ncbi:MAG: O-antigen ligase domain-containing protein [Pedosphaera sp.]|nr:O-antigen ligase domain-containing protein [Pedosphaera sp.]